MPLMSPIWLAFPISLIQVDWDWSAIPLLSALSVVFVPISILTQRRLVGPSLSLTSSYILSYKH